MFNIFRLFKKKMPQTATIQHCLLPFQEIEITQNGDVYTCCPNWNNNYSIGNIYKNDFKDVWNSEKVIELRKRILKNDYSLCNKNVCPLITNKNFGTRWEIHSKPKMKTFPKIIKFSYDQECNIVCKICRKEIIKNNKKDLDLLNSKIETFFLPLLKNAEVLYISGLGDPFGSRHSRLLIKKAQEKYPKLKFDIQTNGLLCNEKNLKNLNIAPENIECIRISVHATTVDTYAKIVKNGEKYFPIIKQNLHYLGDLRKTYGFDFFIHFVVTADNYKEIPLFIKFAEKINAEPRFWEFRFSNCQYEIQKNICVTDNKHPEYEELVKVMQHPLVKANRRLFSPILANLIKD